MAVAMAVTVTPAMAFAAEDGGAAGGIQLQNPVVEDGVSTWDCIYFGSYPQSSDGNDGFITEPIKWRVLSVDGDDAFLLADKSLDARAYNTEFAEVTWETCTLRSWLNGYDASYNTYGTDYSSDNFINTAFTSTEQSAVKTTKVVNNDHPSGIEGRNDTNDKIYLLSTEEVTTPAYGFTSDYNKTATRQVKTTAYAKERGANTNTDGNGLS